MIGLYININIFLCILQTSDDYDKVCDFYQQNNNNNRDVPLHLGFIFDNTTSTKTLQIMILINWYLNDFRGNDLFNERFVVYIIIIILQVPHVYECPTTPRILGRMKRDITKHNILVFIGGCDINTINTFANDSLLKTKVLFYTGMNRGQVCKQNSYIYYIMLYIN